jgi:hypothetical protein
VALAFVCLATEVRRVFDNERAMSMQRAKLPMARGQPTKIVLMISDQEVVNPRLSPSTGGQSAAVGGAERGEEEEVVVRRVVGYLTHHLLARVQVAATSKRRDAEPEAHRSWLPPP